MRPAARGHRRAASVDTRHPDLPLGCTSAPPRRCTSTARARRLFKRGWRDDKGDAPLKETLAAAMLGRGWRARPTGRPLHDPCCGSGTIAIEAAQIACGIAPGLQRRFAFERQLPFTGPDERALWRRLKAEAGAHPCERGAHPRQRRVVPHGRLRAAQCRKRGVAAAIEFHGGDALERPAPSPPEGCRAAWCSTCPTASAHRGRRARRRGRRGQDRDTPSDFFARPSHWKQATRATPPAGRPGCLSPDMKLPSAMRLKETAASRCGTGRSSAGCSASTSWPARARRAATPPSVAATARAPRDVRSRPAAAGRPA